MLRKSLLLFVLSCFQTSTNNALTVPVTQLTTKAKSQLSAVELQDFLSRPANWPTIVASSDRVESETADVNAPFMPGNSVQEYFGLGLLNVDWICRVNRPGTLVFESPDGVPGIASDCSMTFEIRDKEVELTMGYNPNSPIAILATPVLILDNWVALHVLLPAAVDPAPLDTFRRLMGTLYGIAGVAHAADLGLGDSTLFTSVGIPALADLPLPAQVYAAVWCAVGPLAFWCSRQRRQEGVSSSSMSSLSLADLGLGLYGLVEVLGAYGSGNMSAFENAAVVQAIVLAAWWYSSQKEEQQELLFTKANNKQQE
jgi:hypothetical protein